MPQEPATKKPRKGTRSCVECRQRKVRCIWDSDDASKCRNCDQRQHQCVSQDEVERDSDAVHLTSRDRIAHLEENVADLWAYVRSLEGRVNPAHSNSIRSGADQLTGRDAVQLRAAASETSANAPDYLRQLFDSGPLDTQAPTTDGRGKASSFEPRWVDARRRLQLLVPKKSVVMAVMDHASTWLEMHHALFPTLYSFKDVDKVLSQYDKALDTQTHPATVAALLLSIAITVQQIPDVSTCELQGIGNGVQYVKEISDAVEEAILKDDVLVASMEGIEISLLFTRLQLLHINIRKAWLMLRRVIALAEMIGLPRAASRAVSSTGAVPGDRGHDGAVLWQTICAVDRIVSVMFNLPIGTSNHHFRITNPVRLQGRVSTSDYFYRLADIASRVQEIDEMVAADRTVSHIFDNVFKTDEELRALASLAPESWWDTTCSSEVMNADRLLQYWHHYMAVRTHLHLALKSDISAECLYSYSACSQASEDLVQRYNSLRLRLPVGFFACRVLDLQVLTAAIFLLHTLDTSNVRQATRTLYSNAHDTKQSVMQLLEVMTVVSKRPGGDYAQDGATAIQSLMDLLNGEPSAPSETMTLTIPLLGRVHVRRKPNAFRKPSPASAEQSIEQAGITQLQTSVDADMPSTVPGQQNMGLADSLSWFVEIPDEFPFMLDDTSGMEQWPSFGVLDNV